MCRRTEPLSEWVASFNFLARRGGNTEIRNRHTGSERHTIPVSCYQIDFHSLFLFSVCSVHFRYMRLFRTFLEFASVICLSIYFEFLLLDAFFLFFSLFACSSLVCMKEGLHKYEKKNKFCQNLRNAFGILSEL